MMIPKSIFCIIFLSAGFTGLGATLMWYYTPISTHCYVEQSTCFDGSDCQCMTSKGGCSERTYCCSFLYGSPGCSNVNEWTHRCHAAILTYSINGNIASLDMDCPVSTSIISMDTTKCKKDLQKTLNDGKFICNYQRINPTVIYDSDVSDEQLLGILLIAIFGVMFSVSVMIVCAVGCRKTPHSRSSSNPVTPVKETGEDSSV